MLLETEAKNLFALLNPRLTPGAGLVIQFIAATPGEGTSTLSRDFALVASRHTRYPVLLLNLDLIFIAIERCFAELTRQPADTVDPLARPAAIDAAAAMTTAYPGAVAAMTQPAINGPTA